MTIRDLATQLKEHSAETKRQFADVTARFDAVDARFGAVDARFGEVAARFQTITDRIREEGETTRRHFDIVVEQFRSEIRLALDKSVATADEVSALRELNASEHAGFSGVIDDHEARLRRLEK